MKVPTCVTWLLCYLCLQVSAHPPSGQYSQIDPTARTEQQPPVSGTAPVTSSLPNTGSTSTENQTTKISEGFNPVSSLRRGAQRLVDGAHQGLVQGLQEYFSAGSPQITQTNSAGVQYSSPQATQSDPFGSYNQPYLYSGLTQQGQNYNRGASYVSSPTYSYANQPTYPQSLQSSGQVVNYRPGTQYPSVGLGARRPSALAPQQPEVRHEGRGTASVSHWFRKDHLTGNRNAAQPQYQVVDSPVPSTYYGSQASYQPSSSSHASSLPVYQSTSTGDAQSSPAYYSASHQPPSSPSYYSSSPQSSSSASYVPSTSAQISSSPSYYSSPPQSSSSVSYAPSASAQLSSSPSYYSSSPQSSSMRSNSPSSSSQASPYYSSPLSSSSASYGPSSSGHISSSPSYLTSSNQAASSPRYHLSNGEPISSSYLTGASEPSPGYLNHNSHHLSFPGGYFGDHFDFNDADQHSY